ncbi:hypothetical protein M8845_11680 [Gelidibacter japonicus]|jgi:hypothetical protein|uniref:hypothetical protein n=1 Tax=Gelidibacter japonicus TaxID=1962232 RepID=UPI002021BEBD|nr:hypothetical protein [Gelidibacter japonicus]MCL8008086.1 hypothetical protein [Gelidibacter japonicus]
MNPTFLKRQVNFLLLITVMSLVLYGIHSYLLTYFGADLKLFFPVWQIYVFHFSVTTLLYTVVNYKFSTGKTDIFVLFMGSTFVKMFLSILFLLPIILSDFEKKQPDIFNFFIPYFIYLAFEVYSITKFLQKPS